MKNLVLISAVVGMIFFAGCKKDGVYKPSQKISKITYSVDNQYQEETWHWNKNQLQDINHGTWTETYTYEKGRLTRVDDKINNNYSLFEYDGSKLSKITCYVGGVKVEEYNVKYDNKKMSEIEILYEEASLSIGKSNSKPLSVVCSPEIAQIVEDNNNAFLEECQLQHKAMVRQTVTFEWDGKNISKIISTRGNTRTETSFTYDNKINPFYGFLDLYQSNTFLIKNKNNIKTATSTNTLISYDYTYDGQYPETISYESQGRKITQRIEYSK